MARIGVVGGGPAGLAVAQELGAAGHQVSLFEAAPELGGLARSFLLGDARVERYYHFLCRDDTGYFRKAEELGLADRLRWRPTRMGFFHQGRLYPWSSAKDLLAFDGMSLPARLRYGAGLFYCSKLSSWRRLDGVAAEPWLRRLIGDEAYDATWDPLLNLKFDHHADRISAAWVWHRVRRVARSRRTMLSQERLGYLAGGTEQLVEALEAELRRHRVTLRPSTPIERILIEGGRATGLSTAGGEVHRFDRVVVAVPLPHFVRMAPDLPEDYRRRLAATDFLGVRCVTLLLSEPLTRYFWLNVHDDRIPWNGCIELTNLNPEATPDGSSVLYVPYYLPREHPRFALAADELYRSTLEGLRLVDPRFGAERVRAWAVSTDPFAQVVCPVGFADHVPGHRTPVEGLYLIESSQLYPSDRTISGTLDLAHETARLVIEDTPAPAAGATIGP